MPYVTIGERRVFYAHHPGDEHARTLILLHGAGGSRLNWPVELRNLPGATVYALDLPGHGRSDKPGRTSIDDYAQDVESFIDELGLDDVVIVGHSMGGAIAQQLGISQLRQVTALVLVGTGARLRVMDSILEKTLADFPAVVASLAGYLWTENAPTELVTASEKLMAQTGPVVTHGDYTACNGFDCMDQLSRIQVPVLVISGSADLMTPEKYGRFLSEHISNSRFETIDGAGHMMALEQPVKTASLVAAFLDELTSN